MVTSSLLGLFIATAAAQTPAAAPSPQKESASPAACAGAASQPQIAKARAALADHPDDLRTRLRLADAWTEMGCYSDASQVLQQGLALHPRSVELQARARLAKSMVSEQNYFDSLDSAARGAKLSRAAFRCAKLAELAACDEALALNPGDPTILTSEADALLQLKRPGEAIGVYRRAAARSGVAPNALAVKISQAESQRLALLSVCESQSGGGALQACDGAWLPGAPDELRLFKRRALLLQMSNQPAAALQAYMAAARLKPGDKSAALGIVSLTDGLRQADAVTLAARGSALMTLGRAADAKRPLRDALRLVPNLADARQELREAERVAPLEREEFKPAINSVSAVPAADKAALVASAAKSAGPARSYSNAAPVGQSN